MTILPVMMNVRHFRLVNHPLHITMFLWYWNHRNHPHQSLTIHISHWPFISHGLVIHWLVVWNMNFMTFPSSWECHHSNWLIFFRGVGSTTNQLTMTYHDHLLLWNIFFIFHNIYIWDNPFHWLIFFKMVIAPPSSHVYWTSSSISSQPPPSFPTRWYTEWG